MRDLLGRFWKKRTDTEPEPASPIDHAAAKLRRTTSDLANRDALARMLPLNAVGIELGVASGGFSRRLLAGNPSLFLYGVDMYAGDRGHDVVQYKHALRNLRVFQNRNCLIRARFDEVVDLFENDFFDLVYVDGYAHTGEEGGRTFTEWFPKVKPFGIIAGDDYHADWPLVMHEVDRFVRENDLQLFTMANSHAPGMEWTQWFAVKGPVDDDRYVRVLNDLADLASLPAPGERSADSIAILP